MKDQYLLGTLKTKDKVLDVFNNLFFFFESLLPLQQVKCMVYIQCPDKGPMACAFASPVGPSICAPPSHHV